MRNVNISIELAEMIVNWGGDRPSGISAGRWSAIEKYILAFHADRSEPA